MQIVTLTMNPALDKSTRTQYVSPEDKLRCDTLQVEPGGGGINVSRAIYKLGGESHLFYAAGGLNGQALTRLLAREPLTTTRLEIAGETRESFTVLEESSTRQYRFNMPGPRLTEAECAQILDQMSSLEVPPSYLVVSGSLPPGVPDDFYVQLAQRIATWPTRLIVDTSGNALRALLDAQLPLFLIKPNHNELAKLVGHLLADDEAIVRAARTLLASCPLEIMVVSLGKAGVLLVTANRWGFIRSPTVPIVSKIGAGDSTVGGITLGLQRGLSVPEAVRFGVAAGAAAVMTPGTELCRRADAERLFAQMQREAEFNL
jgi:6-phosphofructokinase 2